MGRRLSALVALLLFLALMCACAAPRSLSEPHSSHGTKGATTTLLVAAAASLETCLKTELIPRFERRHPDITVEATYDGSGKLKAQITSGLFASVFLSAAMAPMDELVAEGFVNRADVVPLVTNELVLITRAGQATAVHGLDTLDKARTIALGDPKSVPAGRYAKQALDALHLWDRVAGRVSLAPNVTAVLNQVAAGAAEVGFVYKTDAALRPKEVTTIARVPSECCAPIVYPVAPLARAPHSTAARAFVAFLRSPEASRIFERYGFSPVAR